MPTLQAQGAVQTPKLKRGRGRPPKVPRGPPTRCALYERVSDEDQVNKGVSIPAQDEYLRDWAAQDNLGVMQVYVDEAKSGRTVDSRSEFRRMTLEAAEKRWLFDVVLVYHTDRFARNAFDALQYDRELTRSNVEVRYGNLKGVDTRTPEGRLMFINQIGQAEYFSADLARKVRLGMRKKGSMGYVVGGTSEQFFDLVDDPSRLRKNGQPSRRLVPNDRLYEAVQLRRDGLSYASIARRTGASLWAVRRALLTFERIAGAFPP